MLCTYLNETSTRQHLHDHARCDDGRDAQFHNGATVGGQNDTHPVERVRRLGRLDAVDGDLAADEENEERNGSPEEFFAKGDLWWSW